ncbi:hypothetical protein ACFPTO_02870 [Paraburkholderia denitrificans]|uniref:Uncharacterized protein n=1 Tax=Paraburkholderia denitrificans TaxID=694025 RepID=A0ABW0J3Z2_9BURK
MTAIVMRHPALSHAGHGACVAGPVLEESLQTDVERAATIGACFSAVSALFPIKPVEEKQ